MPNTASTPSLDRAPADEPLPPVFTDERAGRIVAGLTVAWLVIAYAASQHWMIPVAAAGFVVRAISGPRFSLVARAARALSRRVGPPVLVAAAPKRFAQAIGAALTLAASVLLYLGFATAAWSLAGTVAACAALEAAFSFCAGCLVFRYLQRFGIVRQDVCIDCARPST